ncbi:MAG: hypothetical protein ACXWIG_08540 [Caldimonas sp.]
MLRFREMTPQPAGHASPASRWRPFRATSAIDGGVETLPMELSALGAHVDHCNGSRGRMFGLRCAADSLFGFLAPRVVTTLVVVAIVIGVGSLIV